MMGPLSCNGTEFMMLGRTLEQVFLMNTEMIATLVRNWNQLETYM